MESKFTVVGMHCVHCVNKVTNLLSVQPGISSVKVSLENNTVSLVCTSPVLLDKLNQVLSKTSYTLCELKSDSNNKILKWIKTYQPVLLLLLLDLAAVVINAYYLKGYFSLYEAFEIFMAFFFITFSIFKIVNLKNFVSTFKQYDLIAAGSTQYAYLYPFIELSLGLAYLLHFKSDITNTITIIIMGIGALGVKNALDQKKKIDCACLGGFFKLPMSKVALFEDLSMVIMAFAMFLMK